VVVVVETTADDTWQVAGWVRNATDEFYSNGTFNTGDTVSRYAGMRRFDRPLVPTFDVRARHT